MIPTEVLRFLGEGSVDFLTRLIKMIVECEWMPEG